MAPHSSCGCRLHRCCSVVLKAGFRPTAALTAMGRTERTGRMLTIFGESVHQRCDFSVRMLLPSQALHLILCACRSSMIHLDLMDLHSRRKFPEFDLMPAAANLGEQLDVCTHPLLALLVLCKIVVAAFVDVLVCRMLSQADGIATWAPGTSTGADGWTDGRRCALTEYGCDRRKHHASTRHLSHFLTYPLSVAYGLLSVRTCSSQ